MRTPCSVFHIVFEKPIQLGEKNDFVLVLIFFYFLRLVGWLSIISTSEVVVQSKLLSPVPMSRTLCNEQSRSAVEAVAGTTVKELPTQ